MWLWAAELGWWELGNRLRLGGLGLWADYSPGLVYKLEKIICISLHLWFPLFCQIFSHREHLIDRCWSPPGRDTQNCSSKEQSRVQGFQTLSPTWGWGLSCFISQPNGQSPSLQTCSHLSAFNLGYFPPLIHHCPVKLLVLINCGCPIPGGV